MHEVFIIHPPRRNGFGGYGYWFSFPDFPLFYIFYFLPFLLLFFLPSPSLLSSFHFLLLCHPLPSPSYFPSLSISPLSVASASASSLSLSIIPFSFHSLFIPSPTSLYGQDVQMDQISRPSHTISFRTAQCFELLAQTPRNIPELILQAVAVSRVGVEFSAGQSPRIKIEMTPK